MRSARKYLWSWPDGLLWQLTEGFTQRSRERRFALFMRVLRPKSSSRVLDVGVCNGSGRSVNFFEALYPWRHNVTAVASGTFEEFDAFRQMYPEVHLVLADGRALPFADDEFDIVFSNAVVEHVGSRAQQALFVSECLRVGRVLFLSTPNAGFPLDSHTLLPFAHWLPASLRYRVYRALGMDYWASVENLNLLSRGALLKLLPVGSTAQVHEDRLCGFTMSFALVASRGRSS